MEFQDLFNGSIIVDASVASFKILDQSARVDQAAEPQIGLKPFIESLYVLRFQNLTDELQGGIAANSGLSDSCAKRWAATGRASMSNIS